MSEPIEQRRARLELLNSGMGRFVITPCVTCGADAMAAPDKRSTARCTGCLGSSVVPPELAGQYVPVVGYPNPYGAVPRVVSEAPELVAPRQVCEPWCEHWRNPPYAPRPVADLHTWAVASGWQATVRHSVGQLVGNIGKQLAEAEMWSVRFRRGRWAGYAVRRGDAWGSVCVMGALLPPFLKLGVTGLREWLEQPEREERWYADVVGREAAQKLAAKIVKCPGPGHCVLDLFGGAISILAGRRDPIPDHTHRGDGAIKIKTSRSGGKVHGG